MLRSEYQAKAFNQQKTNKNITNVISSDQVGRFPDANIGDALKRVPGITMQNDQGEARNIIIRGLASELNSVTLNGSRIPSAEEFVRVPVPADKHGDLLAAFRVFDFSDAAQVASALQVALFLLGEPVFMERALQQFLVLLHAVQLGDYRAVLKILPQQI